jgi:hypothetical protein
MSRPGSSGWPFLEITTPHLSGVQIPLGAGRTTIGRGAGSSAILHDDTVSRRHAEIELHGGGITLRDLDSRNGTYLNGARISGPVAVNAGDVIAFGSVQAHVVAVAEQSRAPTYDIRDQRAERISNVGGNQYNYEIQRESFLADIASRKTKGRWLVTVGFLCLAAGFGLFAYGVISFIQAVPDIDLGTPPSEAPSPLGPDVGGIPLGAIGFALATIGTFTLVAGIVVHVGAAARLRQVEKTRWSGPYGAG